MELDKKSEKFETIRKPNVLINSKFKSTLLEIKITSLGVSDFITQKPSEYSFDENNRRVITYTSGQLKKHLNAKSGAIYEQFKKVATAMRSRTMLKEDIENNSWKVIGLISKAEYSNGKFSIYFEPEAEEYIMSSNKFSIMQKMLMMGYTSIYAYRLYELLNEEAFKINDVRDTISVYYTITELRFNMCTVNTDNPDVQSKMTKKNANLDKIYESIPRKDIKYTTYDAFKRNVIVVGVDQINEKSDLHVEYKEDFSGVGGKVVGIWFYISYNKQSEIYINDVTSVVPKTRVDATKEPKDIDDLCDEISEYIDVKLKIKDIKALIKESSYDISVVKQAYDEAKETKVIDDFMGWMINCIRQIKNNEWAEPIKTIDGSEQLAKDIDAIKEEISRPEVKRGAWESIKLRDDFEGFVEYIESIGLTIEEFEIGREPEECIKFYADWKLKR